MRKLRSREEDEQEVDISPLIDVVFILLIFFMVSTTFVKDAQLDIDRPSAQSAEPADSKSLRVRIDRKGTVYLGDTQVRLWMLQGRVREELRNAEEPMVLIVADRQTSTERLIDVVDQCRMAGAQNVGVVTDKENTSLGG
jgi:biopolymer transport protein ExbD